jgi:alpha-methylacyl-CoA racemase
MGAPDAPPPVPLNLVGDFGGGGMLLALGIVTALYERDRSGHGQVLDVAMIDGIASLMTSIYQLRAMGDWSDARGEHWVQGAAPWYRAYATADGRFVTVGPLEAKFYALLLARLGLDADEWPQWDRERWPALADVMAQRFAARTLAEWQDELEGTDVCFAPALRTDEAVVHPHMAERGTYVTVDGVQQPAPVPRFSRTPGAIAGPPPWPGEQTLDVLAEIGVDHAEREALLTAGVAWTAPAQGAARAAR